MGFEKFTTKLVLETCLFWCARLKMTNSLGALSPFAAGRDSPVIGNDSAAWPAGRSGVYPQSVLHSEGAFWASRWAFGAFEAFGAFGRGTATARGDARPV